MGKAASPLAPLGGRRHLQAQLIGEPRLSAWAHVTLALSHQVPLGNAPSLDSCERLMTWWVSREK